MRQHVNPLSRFFQLPLQLPAPEALFRKPDQPIHLDIGCARGRCILGLAELNQDWNHLGVEIRRPLAISADRDSIASGQGNVRVLFCNANISLEDWMKGLPDDRLRRISIQFPDPWFKKRHHKRRVIQSSFLDVLARKLVPGGEFHLMTDFTPIGEDSLEIFEGRPEFENLEGPGKFAKSSTTGIMSEREVTHMRRGDPISRLHYIHVPISS